MAELHDIQTFIDSSSKATSFADLKNLLHAISLDMGPSDQGPRHSATFRRHLGRSTDLWRCLKAVVYSCA
jgi:hypothetical protein